MEELWIMLNIWKEMGIIEYEKIDRIKGNSKKYCFFFYFLIGAANFVYPFIIT